MPPYRMSTTMQRGVIVALGAALITAASAGTAEAYWKSTGSGSGTAGTSTVTISATVTGVSGLYPGASVPVTVALKNTSATAGATIVSLVQSGSATIQTAGKGSCAASVVSFTLGTLPSGRLSPGQSGNATGTASMTTAAADGCQGTTFAIPLTATAHTS
jgi:hypothetical protein